MSWLCVRLLVPYALCSQIHLLRNVGVPKELWLYLDVVSMYLYQLDYLKDEKWRVGAFETV
jgi:hypothetical protein